MPHNKFKKITLDLINSIRDDGVTFYFLNKKRFKSGETAHYYKWGKKYIISICMLSHALFDGRRIKWKTLLEYVAHEVAHYLRDRYLLKKSVEKLNNQANLLLYNKKTPQDIKVFASKIVAFDEFQTEVCAVEILKQYRVWKYYKQNFWKFTRQYVKTIKNIPYGGNFEDGYLYLPEPNRKLTKKEIFANVRIKS